ncbi:MAG: LytTR family transcriptional regulator DNA-binding domain-containing protein [Rhizobium sp.]|nr:LytTR family transcriptional regulator DNA-binding domain-containing protein [Rhizobium sp.]
MLAGHNPYLVALSVAVAILGGYTGLGLAARIAGRSGLQRRALLVGAAAFLSIGIWTMHFVGMLAAPLPGDAAYLVLPTIVSYLICALVVGVSVFFVIGSRPGALGTAVAALLLGIGISSMHYVGIHGLAGNFAIQHDLSKVALSVMIAIATAYGALRIFLAPQTGLRLAVAAFAFGLAVSGMHYTAMAGMHFVPPGAGHHSAAALSDGLQVSPQIVSLIVACLCFLIAAGFLLFLLPEQWGQVEPPARLVASNGVIFEAPPVDPGVEPASTDKVQRVPVQSAGATQFVQLGEIRSLRADAHYTWVHDGNRERMCSWSISEAEAALDPAMFLRVHRSHIVAMPHVVLIRKEGDGAVVEVDGPNPHLVPVSRARVAEVKARLGLARRQPVRG